MFSILVDKENLFDNQELLNDPFLYFRDLCTLFKGENARGSSKKDTKQLRQVIFQNSLLSFFSKANSAFSKRRLSPTAMFSFILFLHKEDDFHRFFSARKLV